MLNIFVLRTFIHLGCGTRLDVLLALLRRCERDAPGEKLVLASQYTKMLDRVETLLRAELAAWPVLRLDGAVAVKKRAALVEDFATAEPSPATRVISTLFKAGECIRHSI